MGCPAFVIIGNNLTFNIASHDPDTGVSTDADAVPTYRIYEDDTEAVILNGNMDDGSGGNSEFDDANTTGFYAKTIACTLGNGFEDGKTYSVYISATVDSDTGAIAYAFTAYAQLGGITAGAIPFTYTVTSTVPPNDPIPGVDVWATTDIAGNNTIASGVTDAFGKVLFHLDEGTYYIWRQLAGWDFDNPDTEIVA